MNDLLDIKEHLLSLGFTVDDRNTSLDSGGTYVTYHHNNPDLSTGLKKFVKARGYVNRDGRVYGPSGNQHENFNHPDTTEHSWIAVAKYRDGRGGGRRGTSVSFNSFRVDVRSLKGVTR